jgi:hypothetical protein
VTPDSHTVGTLASVSALRNELDRVGASLKTAGVSAGVVPIEGTTVVWLLGPPREVRRTWHGSPTDALEVLAELDDGAGLESFWAAFAEAA